MDSSFTMECTVLPLRSAFTTSQLRCKWQANAKRSHLRILHRGHWNQLAIHSGYAYDYSSFTNRLPSIEQVLYAP